MTSPCTGATSRAKSATSSMWAREWLSQPARALCSPAARGQGAPPRGSVARNSEGGGIAQQLQQPTPRLPGPACRRHNFIIGGGFFFLINAAFPFKAAFPTMNLCPSGEGMRHARWCSPAWRTAPAALLAWHRPHSEDQSSSPDPPFPPPRTSACRLRRHLGVRDRQRQGMGGLQEVEVGRRLEGAGGTRRGPLRG
jgi:hypothetical protein